MDFTSLSDAFESCTGIVDGISVDVNASIVLIPIRGIASVGQFALSEWALALLTLMSNFSLFHL
jgi:hypothetical protein